MIQRIQSVWLLLAAVAAGTAGTMLANVLNGVTGTIPVPPSPEGWAALGIFSLVALLAAGAILMFSNREKQRRLIVMAQYVALLGIILLLAQLFIRQGVQVAELAPTNMWMGPAAAIATYPLLWMARRGVDADIKLLKSVDRLR